MINASKIGKMLHLKSHTLIETHKRINTYTHTHTQTHASLGVVESQRLLGLLAVRDGRQHTAKHDALRGALLLGAVVVACVR